MSNDFIFDTSSRIEIPVTVDDVKYILKEASGGASNRFRDAMLGCTTLGPSGKPTKMVGLAALEPLLISLCLFNEQGKHVPEQLIESWPARVQTKLYEKAKEISELDEPETKDALEKQRLAIDKKLKALEENAAENAPSA